MLFQNQPPEIKFGNNFDIKIALFEWMTAVLEYLNFE